MWAAFAQRDKPWSVNVMTPKRLPLWFRQQHPHRRIRVKTCLKFLGKTHWPVVFSQIWWRYLSWHYSRGEWNACRSQMYAPDWNRFFWPTRDYVQWYLHDDIIRMIPAPTFVTSRRDHVEIDRDMVQGLRNVNCRKSKETRKDKRNWKMK